MHRLKINVSDVDVLRSVQRLFSHFAPQVAVLPDNASQKDSTRERPIVRYHLARQFPLAVALDVSACLDADLRGLPGF